MTGQRIATKFEALSRVWAWTRGDLRVKIAVLDGPVDRSHASLVHAAVESLDATVLDSGRRRAPLSGWDLGLGLEFGAGQNPASVHGTQVASLIFGQPGTLVEGIAPGCSGVSISIYSSTSTFEQDSLQTTQKTLARGMRLALNRGAQIINISAGAGPIWDVGRTRLEEVEPDPELVQAMNACRKARVLVVSAAGNDGCSCLQIPAAHPWALVAGSADEQGRPSNFSNWGLSYGYHGLLVKGEECVTAEPGQATSAASGTSMAAALISGAAGLLMSLDLMMGRVPDGSRIRQVLLKSADRCPQNGHDGSCHRFLAGSLNLERAAAMVTGSSMFEVSRPILSLSFSRGIPRMDLESVRGDVELTDEVGMNSEWDEPITTEDSSTRVIPMSCSCQDKKSENGSAKARPTPQYVYALGRIGIDLGSPIRRESLRQHMGCSADEVKNPKKLADYLANNPWDARSITWTLNLDETPIYVIAPNGPFARETYDWMREALVEQAEKRIERISLPGFVAGSTELSNGNTVPVVVPERRGMYSWSIDALIKSALDPKEAKVDRKRQESKELGLRSFLERAYYELRNRGLRSEERALNYAATNMFQLERVYELVVREDMELDSITVRPSPIREPKTDRWEVLVYFFYPKQPNPASRRVFRFTVDVNDLVPIMSGDLRVWSTR